MSLGAVRSGCERCSSYRLIVKKSWECWVEKCRWITSAYVALGAVEGVTVDNLRILILRKATGAVVLEVVCSCFWSMCYENFSHVLYLS
jgi:hypothetical protein